jgi:hypothetical protein
MYINHPSSPTIEEPKPGCNAYIIFASLDYFSQAISEEFGLTYYAEKNPELIGKDVSLIPMHINPKLSFYSNSEIYELRKIRMDVLLHIGSRLHCFYISKPVEGESFPEFESECANYLEDRFWELKYVEKELNKRYKTPAFDALLRKTGYCTLEGKNTGTFLWRSTYVENEE